MITALIPLPNFLIPPRGDMTTTVSSPRDTEFQDDVAMYSRARPVHIGRQPLFYKYKLVISEVCNELQTTPQFLHNPMTCMSESEIVFVSTQPINLDTYECDPYAVIYPLYGRTCGQVLLFSKSIDRFLKLVDFYNEEEVITPFEFIQEKTAMYGGILSAGDDWEFLPYAPISWNISLRDIVEIIQNKSGDINAIMAKVAYHRSMFSDLFILVSNAVSWQTLKMYVNSFADKTNNVRNGVVGSMCRWDELYNYLVTNGRIMTQPYSWSARMDLLVHFAHLIGPDFFVTVDMSNDHFDIPDMYMHRIQLQSNFVVGNAQRSGHIKQFVTLLCNALDNPWRGNKVRIHKSCMEDIVVYDAVTNEILLYMDLVWFTLASSNGLINRTVKEYND